MKKSIVLGLLICAAPSFAADWPMFRGVNSDGATAEKIVTTWPVEGPKVVWKVPMGEGFSAISIANNRAFCFEARNEMETVIALDANTGKELWTVPIDKEIKDRQGGNGPRSTPAIDGDRVYILGTYLKLVALNAAD